ncbi:MAG: hypothetical protein ABL888_22100 [Pirellulaceae bacterium]
MKKKKKWKVAENYSPINVWAGNFKDEEELNSLVNSELLPALELPYVDEAFQLYSASGDLKEMLWDHGLSSSTYPVIQERIAQLGIRRINGLLYVYKNFRLADERFDTANFKDLGQIIADLNAPSLSEADAVYACRNCTSVWIGTFPSRKSFFDNYLNLPDWYSEVDSQNEFVREFDISKTQSGHITVNDEMTIVCMTPQCKPRVVEDLIDNVELPPGVHAQACEEARRLGIVNANAILGALDYNYQFFLDNGRVKPIDSPKMTFVGSFKSKDSDGLVTVRNLWPW